MQRQELINLIKKIQRCEGTETEADHDIELFCSAVDAPHAANYIFQEDLDAEQIADKTLDYQPLQLQPIK